MKPALSVLCYQSHIFFNVMTSADSKENDALQLRKKEDVISEMIQLPENRLCICIKLLKLHRVSNEQEHDKLNF